jgi:hypothetical protein
VAGLVTPHEVKTIERAVAVYDPQRCDATFGGSAYRAAGDAFENSAGDHGAGRSESGSRDVEWAPGGRSFPLARAGVLAHAGRFEGLTFGRQPVMEKANAAGGSDG